MRQTKRKKRNKKFLSVYDGEEKKSLCKQRNITQKYHNKKIINFDIYLITILAKLIIILIIILAFFFEKINKMNKIEKEIRNVPMNNSGFNNSFETDLISKRKNEIQIDENNINEIKISQNIEISNIIEKKKQNISQIDYRQIALENGIEYMKLCREGKLINDKSKFIKNFNPKISVIMPMFNCENTLKAAVKISTKSKNVRHRDNNY